MNSSQSSKTPQHVPVLAAEVLALLDPLPGQVLVDATVGGGGHARLLAEKLWPSAPPIPSPPPPLPAGVIASHPYSRAQSSSLIGLDRDAGMLELARQRLSGLPVTLIHASFADLPRVLKDLQISAVDGIVADLGFSSDQMADASRGFSFQQEGPLDMRLDPAMGEPASSLLARLDERALADLIWEYGEERFSRRIARRIVATRRTAPLTTTTQLADLVRRCVPRGKSRIDPATRTFQALRIAVNDELGALERFLRALPGCLNPGGRVAIISFHSLEDRLVKQAFREKEVFETLARKPIQASDEEIRNNPRARSAKLRGARRVSG